MNRNWECICGDCDHQKTPLTSKEPLLLKKTGCIYVTNQLPIKRMPYSYAVSLDRII